MKKLIFFSIIFLLLFVGLVSAGIDEPAPYTATTLDTGYTAMTGYKFTMDNDEQIESVTKESGQSGVTVAYVLDSSMSVIATSSVFVGETAFFSPSVSLTSGTTYYIAFDNGGSSYDLLRYLGASYPVSGNNVTWIAGLGQSGGLPVDVSNVGYVLDYMTFVDVVPEVNDSVESTAFIEQVGTVSFTGGGPHTILSGDFNVSLNNTPSYGVYTFGVRSSANNIMYCEALINGVVVANKTRSNSPLLNGTMKVMYPIEVLENGTNSEELRCIRQSGPGSITISQATGVNHFLVNQDGDFLNYANSTISEVVTSGSSYTLIESLNITTGSQENESSPNRSQHIIIEASFNYFNFDTNEETLNVYANVNGTNCTVAPRTVGPSGDSGSVSYDCFLPDLKNDSVYQIDFYANGTNARYDANIVAKNFFMHNDEIVGGTGDFVGLTFSGDSFTPLAFPVPAGNQNHDIANAFTKLSYSITTDLDTNVQIYFNLTNGNEYLTKTWNRDYVAGEPGFIIGQDVLELLPKDDYNVSVYANCGTVGANCTITGGQTGGYVTDVVTVFVDSFNVSGFDFWDNSSIPDFNVTNGGTTTSVNGSAIIFTRENFINLTISSFGYYNETVLNHNTSLDLNVSLKQSDIKFTAYEIISNSSLASATFTIDGVTKNVNESFYLKAGSYNVTVASPGYFSSVESINVSPLDNLTYSYTLGNSRVNITAFNFLSGALVSNYTIEFNYLNGSYVENFSTSSPYLSADLIQGYFNITFYKSGFLQNEETLFVNDSLFNYSLAVYGLENVSLNFFDEETLLPVNNVFFDVLGSQFSGAFNTSGGNDFLLADLPEDIYQIRYTADDYSARSYYVVIPITDASFVNLSLYLVNDSNDAIFTRKVVGQDAIPLDGSYLEVQRPYASDDNTSLIYRTMEIAIIDSSGDAVFSAIPNTQQYRFRILDNDLNLLNTLTPSFLIDTTGEIIADESLSTMIDYNLAIDVVGVVSFQNTTSYFIFDYTAPAGITQACLRVTNNTGYSSTYSETCSTNPSGTIAILVDDNLSVTYEALGYVIIDGQQFAVDTDSLDLRFLNERDPLRYIGPFVYFIAIILFGAMSFVRPVIGIFGAVGVTACFGLQFLGLMWFSTALIGGLMVLGIIIAIVSGRRS